MEFYNITQNYSSVINSNFYLNNYERKDGTRQIILTLTSQGKRKRLALDLFVSQKNWNPNKQRVKNSDTKAADKNLILEQAHAKITDIKVFYRLNDAHLSMDKLIEDFRLSTPSFDFISFMEHHIKRASLKASTRKAQLSRCRRLKGWKDNISFSNINLKLMHEYRHYLDREGLQKSTINGHFRTIATYLRLASKYGIKLQIDPAELETKNIKSKRTALTFEEVEKLFRYWESEFIPQRQKLPLGYFLFACKTGLRLSEWKSIKREDFKKEYFVFFNSKSEKYIRFKINDSVRNLIDKEPLLFEVFKSDQKMRQYLQEACKQCKIDKRIDFHTGRHTFATHFAQRGGKAFDLQSLLGHSNISTTMIYYHPNSTGDIDTSILD